MAKFRSLEEIRKHIQKLTDQYRVDTQLVDRTEKALARLSAKAVQATDFKILDISGDGKKSRKKTYNVDFPMVKVPNAKELTHSYNLAERLSEQYKYALNLENEVRLNFSNVNKHSAVETTLGSIQKLKSALEKDLKRLFAVLNSVAQGHAPAAYLEFVTALADELMNKKHIECDSAKTMTYAAIAKPEDGGALVFAGYLMMVNAVSDDGKVAPTLYVVVKWTVGGNVEIFVEHEFIAPSLLRGGITVENLKEATKAVADQLSLEGFSSQLGNLPVSTQLRYPDSGIAPSMFSAAQFISKVTPDENELVFTFKANATKNIPEVKNQLFLEVKAMVKRKRGTTVRMSVKGNQVIFTFAGLDQSGGIHPHDLEFLGDKYKLEQHQLRKIANIINGE